MASFLPAAAVILDSIVGDPRSAWHPVVLIGKMISWLESLLLRPLATPAVKQGAGLVLVVITLAVSYGVTWLAVLALDAAHPLIGFIGGACLLAFTISPRSLAEAGLEIKAYLDAGDLVQARAKVGWIVGRDTAELGTAEVTRATVETVAENIVDGIISPLFYAFIGGVPLAFLYRAVNTLDSMVAYKNEKYSDFGLVAARVDDLFNYIPARISGLLLVVAAAALGYDAGGAARCIHRDAAKHPSPNSGISEAGVAGALGVRLGGLNYYGGLPSHRAEMGEPRHELQPVHIAQTVKLLYLVTFLFVVIATGLTIAGLCW
ncbi:MAG: adenosylcobinamide-phosphate synthase CbiB [Negativicutes bacterium]|nr:adenosylcobinamide-phosphate synthase CbiB [Negativicutes bacterium]